MRIAAELMTTVGGALSIFAFAWNRLVVRPRRSNLDHVRELEAENKEIDRIRERFERGAR